MFYLWICTNLCKENGHGVRLQRQGALVGHRATDGEDFRGEAVGDLDASAVEIGNPSRENHYSGVGEVGEADRVGATRRKVLSASGSL